MRLFIKVENGVPVDHPMLEGNVKQAYPGIDLENLPANLANFIRKERPAPGMFEVSEGPTYTWNGEAFEDTYTIRDMTEEEKAQKIAKYENVSRQEIDTENPPLLAPEQ